MLPADVAKVATVMIRTRDLGLCTADFRRWELARLDGEGRDHGPHLVLAGSRDPGCQRARVDGAGHAVAFDASTNFVKVIAEAIPHAKER